MGVDDEYSGMSYRDLQKLAKTAGVKANLPKAELVAALQKSAEEWISDDEDEKSAPLHEKNTPLEENSVDDKNTSYDVQNPIIVDDQAMHNDENIMSEDEEAAVEVLDVKTDVTDTFNSTFEVDTESSILDRKFELDDTPNNRRSTRLSIGQEKVLIKETKNSPEPATADPGSGTLTVPNRFPTIRAGRRSTPKSLGKAQPRNVLKGVSSASKKISSTTKSAIRSTPLAKKVLTLKSSARATPLTAAKKTETPRSIVRPTPKKFGTPKSTVRPTPLTSSKKTPRADPSLASNKKKSPSSMKKPSATNIPRFVKFARKVPDFAKLHEKQFKKMEGLDDYLDKKEKRSEVVKEQILKARTLTAEHTRLVEQVKARTPAFVPSVTSTSKMNLNFGSTRTPAGGASTAKKPFKFTAAPATAVSAKKAKVERTDIKAATKEKSKPKARAQAKAVAATPKVEERTPMKPLFNFNNKSVTGTPASAKKFNLKASLAKPLAYKPHAGKLPSWGHKKTDVKDLNAVSTKEVMERTRNIIKGVRMNKRAALLLQNRNIKE